MKEYLISYMGKKWRGGYTADTTISVDAGYEILTEEGIKTLREAIEIKTNANQ